MKIKRTPIKTLPSLPPELINIIDHLLTGGPISRWTVKEWKFPKSDFFQFVSVLNLFDDKLDSLCKTYELNVHIQNKPFDENDKQTLLSILNFTRLLFDNCSNRNLYNSYEYLNSLLYTTDIDILEATLALLLKPAQRMNNPTAAQSNFSIKDETVITELAKNGDITLFTSNETTNVKKLSASFYKEEGGELETIDVSLSAKPDQDIFWETVNKHQIPSGYHFELLNKIRLANHNHSISTRRQLLKIRLMSIVILAHTMPEATAQNRLYIYEPNLTAQIVQLLSFENQIPTDIQTYALYALDAIARHKMKLTEVLNTLNAAANHGILLHTLRQLSSGPVFPQAFLDAFFTLLSFLIDTVAGGQMLSSAGIVNACVHIIDNEHAKPNVLTKVISVLDIAFDSLENAYPNFFHSNGLNASISALKIQVDICVSEPQHHDSTILVKTILRFIIRMIKSSHAGSTLRNLMETSVPLILTKIMDQQKLVGSTMFGLALSLYASYIHMEPTSLTVLEELQVPQTFLKAFMAYEGYCDVNLLLNVIDAFSATCLSEQGLDMFQEIQPLPYFFKLMSSEHFLKNPVEVTETSEIGGEMSELVRHQPALKVQMFSCIHTMLQKVVTLGKSELPEDESHQLTYGKVPIRTRVDSHLLSLIEMSARFLDGFLEFGNVNEFIDYKGHEILLRYYSLPMLPFDYYLSDAFGALSDVFRLLAERQTIVIIKSILNEVRKSADVIIKPKPSTKSSVAEYIYVDGTNEELLKDGNQALREFSFLVGRVGLLANTLALLVLQKDEPCGEFIEYLYNHRETRDTTSDIGFFELLGSIHRHLIWETVLLRNAVPKTWYAKQIVLKKDGTAEEIEEADLTDPRVVNTRRFSELLSGVSPVIMLLFQSIIKLEPYINRNPSEEEGCKWFLISREISVEILKNFQWITESFENREDYIAAVSTLFSMLILEDTERRHMVSLVAVWFGAIGGIRWVVDNLTTPYSQKVANMISREDVNTTAYEQANSCLEVLYPVLQHLSIPSLYSDSVLKDIAERDKKLEMLYPENWLIFVRSGILRIKCVLDEPEFPQFPKHTIRAFLGCIKQCMYLHGERFTKLEDGFSADHGFSDLQVEDEYLQDLVTRIKNSVSPAPEETYDIVQDMSGIPEDDNDEEYEDYDDDDGDVDETGVSISFIGRAAYLLNSLRRAIRSKLPKVLISLVQDREDLDFIVRDTLIALACGDPSEAEENSKLMAQFFEGMATNGEDTLSLFENCVNRIRIFALMLREPKVQGFVSEWVSALSKLIGWVEFLEIATDNPEFSNPKWLTTLFLILESSIAQAENRPYDDSNHIDTINASVLIRCCVRLLLMDNLTEDNLLSTLRIIVRLTKRPELAKDFLLASGLPALFERPRCHFDDTVRIQQAYVIIILRHMMEDKHVMSNLMREWLMFCSRKYYSKTLPFEKKMKMAQPLFLRHPTEFIDLIQNINEGDKLVFNKKSPIEEDNHYMSRTVVHYILKELVITQANPEETNQKLGYTGYLIECLLELVSSYPSCKEDIISYKVPLDIKFHYTQDMVPESNHSILNVFLNIMVPYGLMNAVTDIERKRKCIFIWTVGLFVSLCYDTAHSGNMKPNDDQASDSGSESSWQDKPGTQGPEDEERGEILTAVRTQVMQAIAGFLEYYTKAKTRSSAKYAKYYTLAELCHYILNSRQADINPHYVVSPLVKEKNTKDLTKLMIDNNFVPLLVDAIQNVDVNYPNAKFILNSLLRPLEKLAKMASWFEQERPYDQKRERLIQERYYSVMDSERSTTPVDEIEELYRNSSMAILDGTAVEDDEEDHTDFNSEDEEIDMASSGEESINDEDHEESSEDEMMVDVEHDEDEEDDADREMNELMRNHRHHLPDTDEENSSGTEESLDEDEDDSSDSFEEEAVSDVYNSDMSDEVESEHEENWYAHNNERQRERTAGNDLFPNEEGETEDEEIVNGPQGYDITVRRRTAGGSRNMVVVNNHPNTIHMPSVAGSLGTSNKIQFLSKELPFSRDDIILHPLLRKFVDHATSDLKECITGSTSMSHLQPYKDIIGHGALVTLQSAVSSSYRPAPNDDNINPEILDAGLIVPDSDVVTESNEDDKENKNVLHMLLEFSPVPTIERWNQVTQMAFINITAAAIAKTMAARLPEVEIEQRHGEDKEDYVFEEEGDSPTAALYSFQNISENETPSTAQEDNINITFRGQEVEVQRNDIGPQFLDALPEDFRAQLLNAQDNDDDDVFVEVPFDGLDPDFLAALPDDIREDLVRQEETISLRRRLGSEEREDPAQSPENIQDNQEQTQESPSDEEEINITDFDENELPTENITAPKPTQFLDIIRIVDRSQLSILARLLFVPQSIVKVLLNRLLLNLCENTTTCDDLLSLLLCVLQDECSDLPAVDRSFSRLLNQVVATGAEKDKSSSSSVSKTSSLISQRCLEILYYVLQISWHSRLYFMVENEQFGRMENGKNRYSFLVLIDLLRRPSFLNNAQLMEQLMEILSRVCRSIPNYIEYCKNVSEENRLGDMTIMLPSKYFERVVRVLTTNECSSRTFRFTLSILSNLAHIDNGFEIIITSLKSVATQSGLLISKELEVVLSILEKLKIGKEMETSALKQFSTATSQQMKLLRVLNTMRYLYAKKNKIEENDDEEEDAKIKPEMYDGIDLQPLWKVLGSCLRIIRDKEDLVDVGNVLLPLVECFMTVSKDCISTETISDQNTLFIEFTNEHKKLLNMMVRNNPFLMNGPFSCLAHVPMILDFDNKRAYFTEVLRKAFNSAEKFPTIQLSVRREYTFEDTYEQIHELTSDEVRYGKLKVQFNDEEGVDEGGVSREWLSTLARQMFDPNYALFITSAADKLTYLPNRASGVNPDHLSYFKFVGRIIGKAIHDDRLLDAYFTRSFYKLILGRPVDYKDLEAVDPAYYKSLVWMLENDITNVIDLTFSVEVDDFGTTKIIDLKPDGENIPVTQENKHEYVNLITSQKLVLAIKPQVDAFLEGFYEIIPYQNIKIFNEQELELLISGLPDIDIDDWKANTEYQGYNFQSPQIQWFWRAVRSFDEEERAKLLQFATGTSKVPLGGFSALQGSNGLQRFQIHKEFSDTNRLPSAHTCFNQVDLPQYQTYEDLRRSLFKAISECSIGFGFV